MASGSKGKRTPPRSRRKLKKNNNPGIAEEILLFGTLGAAVLMFLGCLGLLGKFGRVVHDVLCGLFGLVGFLFPFIFFIVCAFIISNKWEKVAKIKLSASLVLIIVLCCASQLIFGRKLVNPDNNVGSVKAYYTNGGVNGGFIGGILTRFFWKYIGIAGTVVILIVLFVICIVLLTDRSFFTSIKEGGRMFGADAKRNFEYRKKVNEVRSMEREERDLERWAKRNEKHNRHVEKQELKRARQLEERKRRAEERRAENAGRMDFSASDLKSGAPKDIEEITPVTEEADESLTYPGEKVVPEEEIRALQGPESLFYANQSTFVSTVKKPEEPEADENPGLLTATKLAKRDLSGEVTEITGFYEGASEEELFGPPEPTETLPPTVRTHHKISISRAEDDAAREAYERDQFIDDEDTFEDDYSDVAEIFDRKNAKEIVPPVLPKTSHGISINPEASVKRETAAAPAPAPKAKSTRSPKGGRFKLPPVSLLNEAVITGKGSSSSELNETAMELKEVLEEFGLDIEIQGASRGPAVTRYEILMPTGVSVKKITGLSDDIMMRLGAKAIRIEAPIPGKKAVGIEIPNKETTMVHFRELIESRSFKNFDSRVAFAVGKDLAGDIVVADIAKMVHVLIAGATGSGKSVCINTIIMSILYKASPEEVRLIMIDPKMVELSVYNGIPHLLIPVVTNPKKASSALAWAVNEMEARYQKFSELDVRNIKGYNEKIAADPTLSEDGQKMPQIVIVVDELADLMMTAAKEVEDLIVRLAQKARAAGIYLILATQRPSVDVITGLIKANMPSRIAFSVSSGVDSRTILDRPGAEKLLGYGDMFFFPTGYNNPARVQGAYVGDDEVARVAQFLKDQTDGGNYDLAAQSAVEAEAAMESSSSSSGGMVNPNGTFDDLFVVAGQTVIETQKASIGMFQRKFKVGFNRAARIMDQLCDEGVVGPEEGTKPRKILMTMDEFNQLLEEKNHQ
ncbi:MAG: DNA translocase FtsK [Lachnospiraceae bacterium]|nr:DNA translocase FtsK [Lachnospiraceae bacterium]